MVLKKRKFNLFFLFIIAFFSVFLVACSSVSVPEIGVMVPCQIQSIDQVKQAINEELNNHDWKIISNSMDQAIQARKTMKSMQASIEIAYGYRGFSIEYLDSSGMKYDEENNTIDPTYKSWVYHLMTGIQKNLEKKAALNPNIHCFNNKEN